MPQFSSLADEIVSAIGYAEAARFFSHFGGKQIKIPNGRGTPGVGVYRLREFFDEKTFQKLITRFGGENITVPRGKAKAMIARNKQIVADFDVGVDMLELIHRYNLCERQIRTILNRPTE